MMHNAGSKILSREMHNYRRTRLDYALGRVLGFPRRKAGQHSSFLRTAQCRGGSVEKLLDDFLGGGLDHPATDRCYHATDLRFTIVLHFRLAAFFAEGEDSLPFQEAGRDAAFDAHLKRFRGMLISKMDGTFKFSGEGGDAHFHRDFVTTGAVGREFLCARQAFCEEVWIGERSPDALARRRKERGTLE
ncbi:MAG: hypothetical protein WBD21_14365, partial [Candidatus Acidiferrales bacterium]